MTDKRIVEINGVKLEVDMRYAVRVDQMRVGTKVRVLEKGYGGHSVHNGVIVGFEPFKELPTIIVAYASVSYSTAEIKFLHYNAKSENVEIVPSVDDDLDKSKSEILGIFDRMILTKQNEIADIEARKSYFLDKFAAYWEPTVPVAEPEVSA